MQKYDSDDGNIFFLRNSCDACLLKPKRCFTIQDIWNTFGYNWDMITESKLLPTLNLGILERLAIAIALKQTNFSQKKASNLLDISQRSL